MSARVQSGFAAGCHRLASSIHSASAHQPPSAHHRFIISAFSGHGTTPNETRLLLPACLPFAMLLRLPRVPTPDRLTASCPVVSCDLSWLGRLAGGELPVYFGHSCGTLRAPRVFHAMEAWDFSGAPSVPPCASLETWSQLVRSGVDGSQFQQLVDMSRKGSELARWATGEVHILDRNAWSGRERMRCECASDDASCDQPATAPATSCDADSLLPSGRSQRLQAEAQHGVHVAQTSVAKPGKAQQVCIRMYEYITSPSTHVATGAMPYIPYQEIFVI